MKRLNYLKGKKQEAIAQNFLKKKGYKILESNFSTKIGEIDIVANDKNVIVFVEVKYRTTDGFGLPREAVNRKLDRQVEAPVKKGQKVGTLSIYVNGICYDTVDIRTSEKMEKEGVDAVIIRLIHTYLLQHQG